MPILLNRRQLLAAMAASAALAVPRRAQAASIADRRFLFVYTMGGWDPTRVFAPLLGLPSVSTEPDAAVQTAGNIEFVAHPNRPAVSSFIQQYHSQITILNGVYSPSISHSGGLRTTWTGTAGGTTADWPTRMAAVQAEQFAVPYLVIGGPYFAGTDGVFVCRAGSPNQLASLVSGDALTTADIPANIPRPAALSRIDQWLSAEAAIRGKDKNTARAHAATEWSIARQRAADLRALDGTMDFGCGPEFSEQIELATRALSSGLSRVVSMNHPKQNVLTDWDSHAGNDERQSSLYESLFRDLATLMQRLESEDSPSGGTLASVTTIIVMSEMGRTPTLNASGGKDHWPYTSVMYIGPAALGGRVVGAFDDTLYGERVDLSSGDMSDSGELLSVETMGATLLRMADIDPRSVGVAADALEGVLA